MENKNTQVKDQQPKQKPVQQSANDTKIKPKPPSVSPNVYHFFRSLAFDLEYKKPQQIPATLRMAVNTPYQFPAAWKPALVGLVVPQTFFASVPVEYVQTYITPTQLKN